MKKYYLLILLFIILALGIALLAREGNKADQPLLIGVSLDLSGPAKSDNAKIRDGIELAKEELPSERFFQQHPFELVWEDDQCSTTDAVSILRRFLQKNIVVVIGGSCSSVTLAMAPVAEENKVILVSPYSSNPSLTFAGDYIFRTVPSDVYEAGKMAEYMVEQNKKSIATLAIQNDYGKGLVDILNARLKELGGEIAAQEWFFPNVKDVRTQWLKIQRSGAKAVYLVGYQKELIQNLKTRTELGISVPVFSITLMEDPLILQEAGEAAEGVVYSGIFFDPDDSFQKKFLDRYGRAGGTLEAIGYDTMIAVGQAFKSVLQNNQSLTSANIKEALYQLSMNEAALGTWRFDSRGDISWPVFLIKKVERGTFVEIKRFVQ